MKTSADLVLTLKYFSGRISRLVGGVIGFPLGIPKPISIYNIRNFNKKPKLKRKQSINGVLKDICTGEI
jgi:hypothetical protein